MNKPEQNEQIHYIRWLRNKYPGIITIISPIVKYGGNLKQRLVQGRIQNLMGYTKGSMDVFVPIASKGFHGLFIEFKFGLGKTSPEQNKVIATLESNGYLPYVCWSCKEAIFITEEYLKG